MAKLWSCCLQTVPDTEVRSYSPSPTGRKTQLKVTPFQWAYAVHQTFGPLGNCWHWEWIVLYNFIITGHNIMDTLWKDKELEWIRVDKGSEYLLRRYSLPLEYYNGLFERVCSNFPYLLSLYLFLIYRKVSPNSPDWAGVQQSVKATLSAVHICIHQVGPVSKK